MLKYYIVDTETTGLRAGFQEITEISIIRADDLNQLTRYIKCHHPERADARALQKTGRTFDDLLKGDGPQETIRSCNEFFKQDGLTPEHRCVVAHNASFDRRFLHALWGEYNREFPVNHWMDTIKFARTWSKQIGKAPQNFQLETVLKFADIKPIPGAHVASIDAQNTFLLWKKGVDAEVDHLPAIQRVPHSL